MICLFPEIYPFVMFCLPWFWVTIRGSQDGGFSVEIEESPKNGPPDQIAYIEFYPHQIRGQYWRIPNTPEAWRGEFIAVWDEFMEWLKRGTP